MFSVNKNSYLQSYHNDINPRLLNRCVAEARRLKIPDVIEEVAPFNRLTSEQPNCPIEHIDDLTRRPCAFGRLALPLLRRELHSKDTDVRLKAVTTINDLVHNPENAYRAIKLQIPERMADLIMVEQLFLRERICLCYRLLANYADGKEVIVKTLKIFEKFSLPLNDPSPEVRIKIAGCLEQIASTWMTADYMVERGYIQIMLDLIVKDQDEISAIHLRTLAHLMYGNGKEIAMEAGAFDIMLPLLDVPDLDVRIGALKCLMMMTSTPLGKRLAYDADILITLNKLLGDNEKLHGPAAAVVMFCTILTKAKIRAGSIKKLPTQLVRMCRNHLNPDVQLYAIKALTNISENPDIRKLIFTKYMNILNKIVALDEVTARHKKALLEGAGWDPSDIKCKIGENIENKNDFGAKSSRDSTVPCKQY